MPEEVFLKAADDIEISATTARFGPISYQTVNISSVAVTMDRKFNPIAILLLIIGLVLGIVAFQTSQTDVRTANIEISVTVVSLILAIVVQLLWPKKVFTFVLKTSSDIHKIVSEDGEGLTNLKVAIERCFMAHRLKPADEAERDRLYEVIANPRPARGNIS